MLDKNGCKNKIIGKMFEEIKNKYVLATYKNLNDVIIEQDEERVYQLKCGVLEYEQFKLNLSIPSDPVDKSDCLGTYINIKIPQYDSIGVLFMPQENGMFKYSPTWSYNVKYFNEIETNTDYTYEQCINMAKQMIDLFLKAFLKRQNIVENIIKLKYQNIKESIKFKKIEIEFIQPVTENRNSYLFYYNKDLKTVFLNDIFKTNYKSVINGIEEIATQIVKTNLEIDPINTKWINMFININNNGIILQSMQLKKNIYIEKVNIFSKIIFKNSDIEEFISYTGVEFNTEYYISQEEVVNIWNNILSDNIN